MGEIKGLSIILPVLNERENLRDLIPELLAEVAPLVESMELIVVDDSSTDGTGELVMMMQLEDTRIRYISRIGRSASLPGSLTDGVRDSRFPIVAWMDADGSMPASSMRELVITYQGLDEITSLVVGSRFVRGGGFKGIEMVGETSILQVLRNLRSSNDSFSAVLLSRLLNRYLWLLLKRCCRDLASGFLIAERTHVQRIGLRGSYGDYCCRFIYLSHEAGYQIVEVPYVCRVRRHGVSKTGTTLISLIKRGLPYVALPFCVRFGRK